MKNYLLILALVSGTAWAGCQSRVSTVVNNDEAVSTNTLTVCGEGPITLENKVKIGQVILETEVEEVPALNFTYFKHRHSKCRLFRERYMFKNVLQVNHGVICQKDTKLDMWTVVDKW
jgi:hypothetical protein